MNSRDYRLLPLDKPVKAFTGLPRMYSARRVRRAERRGNVHGGVHVRICGKTADATTESFVVTIGLACPSATGTPPTRVSRFHFGQPDTGDRSGVPDLVEDPGIGPMRHLTRTVFTSPQVPDLLNANLSAGTKVELVDGHVDKVLAMFLGAAETAAALLATSQPVLDLVQGPTVRVSAADAPIAARDSLVNADINAKDLSCINSLRDSHAKIELNLFLADPDPGKPLASGLPFVEDLVLLQGQRYFQPLTKAGQGDPKIEACVATFSDGRKATIEADRDIPDFRLTVLQRLSLPEQSSCFFEEVLALQELPSRFKLGSFGPDRPDHGRRLFGGCLYSPGRKPGLRLRGDLPGRKPRDFFQAPETPNKESSDSVELIDKAVKLFELAGIGKLEGAFGSSDDGVAVFFHPVTCPVVIQQDTERFLLFDPNVFYKLNDSKLYYHEPTWIKEVSDEDQGNG